MSSSSSSCCESDAGEMEEEDLFLEAEGGTESVAAVLDDALLLRLRHKPDAPALGPTVDFLLLDIQVRQDHEHGTVVALFGRAEDGGSIAATLHGWYPHLYVEVTHAGFW